MAKATEQREALISEIKANQRTIEVSQLEDELQKLRSELERGQKQRAALDQQILFISGAIKILEELIAAPAVSAEENTG